MSRINIQKLQPEAYRAFLGLEDYLAKSTLPALLRELVRLRASQMNGCQFCQGLHTQGAKELGETEARLTALADWRASDLFDDQEQVALAVTEAMTHIAEQGLPDALYQQAADIFSEQELAQLLVLIATINAWNRLGVATKM